MRDILDPRLRGGAERYGIKARKEVIMKGTPRELAGHQKGQE